MVVGVVWKKLQSIYSRQSRFHRTCPAFQSVQIGAMASQSWKAAPYVLFQVAWISDGICFPLAPSRLRRECSHSRVLAMVRTRHVTVLEVTFTVLELELLSLLGPLCHSKKIKMSRTQLSQFSVQVLLWIVVFIPLFHVSSIQLLVLCPSKCQLITSLLSLSQADTTLLNLNQMVFVWFPPLKPNSLWECHLNSTECLRRFWTFFPI